MFESFGNIFKSRPKRFLGIDIGTSFIRVVELGRNRDKKELINYGYLEEKEAFEPSVKGGILSLSNRNIAKAITTILEEAQIKTKDVNFSIPDFNSFFTSFDLPVMDKKEIPGAVRFQVRPFVPLPLEEIDLDWTIISGQPSKTPLKVLVVAIPKETINQYQEIANLVGLNLRFLESEVFSLSRSLMNGENEERKKKVIGLVDIGAWSTTCSVIDAGVLKNSYSFNIAGNELTNVIDKTLGLDYNKAEELKKRCGILPLNPKKTGVEEDFLISILTPLIDSILREVKRVFRDFYRLEGKEMDEVILAGGTALLPGLREYFEKNLNKKTTIANPLVGLEYPKEIEIFLKDLAPSYGISIGLALKGFE